MASCGEDVDHGYGFWMFDAMGFRIIVGFVGESFGKQWEFKIENK